MGAEGFAPGVSYRNHAEGPTLSFHLVELLNDFLLFSHLFPKPVHSLIAK